VACDVRAVVDDQAAEGLTAAAGHHPGLAGIEPEALVADDLLDVPLRQPAPPENAKSSA
jgi:hypothetical protein